MRCGEVYIIKGMKAIYFGGNQVIEWSCQKSKPESKDTMYEKVTEHPRQSP
jgi:hypothetical protein